MTRKVRGVRLTDGEWQDLQTVAKRTGGTPSEVIRDLIGGNGEVRKQGFGEMGVTGLRQTSGFIYEEFHPRLQGDMAIQTYEEMRANDSTVRGVLRAITMVARQIPWAVEPGGDRLKDRTTADFVWSCFHDMSESWQQTLGEILSMVPFGWSFHEEVLKLRQGPKPLLPGAGSLHDDGRIGWRKLPIRAQTSRARWELDAQGGIAGMWQWRHLTTQEGPAEVLIPIGKALLFRPDSHKGNPEGESALRAAYRPWYFKKHIEQIEAIGVERDLNGLPIARIPGSEIADNSAIFQEYQKIVRNLRKDEQQGLVLQSDVDPETQSRLFDIELLTTGSRRQIETTPILARLDRAIARSLLADFLFLGEGATGSYALAEVRGSLFATAMGSWADAIAAVFNRHGIPRLLYHNALDLSTLPTLTHGDLEPADLAHLATMLRALEKHQVVVDLPEDQNVWRELLGLRAVDEATLTDRLDELNTARMDARSASPPRADNAPPKAVDDHSDEEETTNA